MMKKFLILVFLFLAAPALAGDYVIGDGDGLGISVWGVPDLSAEVIVRPDGKITLPAVGEVTASGLTPVQLGEELTKVLTTYVKTPIVTVSVQAMTNNRVYLFGGGVPSRMVSLSGRTTLFKLLCSIGGIESADLRHAYLLREGKKLEVDFYQLLARGDLSRDVEVLPEDSIFIPTNELNKIYVAGAVKEPKYIFHREGVTVLDAILEAGGFNEYANDDEVTIVRNKTEKIGVDVEALLKGKDMSQNLPLLPGDYVIVEEGMF